MAVIDEIVSKACRAWERLQKPVAVYGLAVLVLVWLVALAWMRPLHIPDEGRYVGVAWDMVRFESTWTPLLNGLPYFHKPPLFYWLTGLSFNVFGVHEWAARLPSVLIAWLSAMALFVFVRRHRSVEVALTTLLVLVTMPYFYGAAQYANLDMLVAGLITLTILAGAEAVSRSVRQQPKVMFYAIAMGVLAALGVLAKGLIGVVLPGVILCLWLLLTRRFKGFGVLLGWPVWVAFFVVALPWFVVMEIEAPGFLHYFFIYQHFERYLSGGFNQQQPFWFYVPVVLGFCAPWSVWLVRYAWQRGPMTFEMAWHGLMLVWVLVIFVFFSFPSSKLIGYAVPLVPALAVLIAEAVVATWHGARTQRDIRLFAWTSLGAVALCLAMLIGFMFANPESSKGAAAAMQKELQPDDRIVMLDIYPFDFAFYTKHAPATWVIYNWSKLAPGDTWRDELKEAGEFSPMLAGASLIEPDNLTPLMCLGPDRTYWVGAFEHEAALWPWLVERASFYEKRNGEQFWKVPVDTPFRQQWCS